MRRLYTILLVAGATLAVTVSAGGSAVAGGNPAPAVSPAMTSSQPSFQDDAYGGCRSHRAHVNDAPAVSIKG